MLNVTRPESNQDEEEEKDKEEGGRESVFY